MKQKRIEQQITPVRFRDQWLHRLRRDLERNSNPRLQMLLLVMLTGGAGFVCSYILLQVGMDELWLRYLCSVAFAYLAFLLLLRLWLNIKNADVGDSIDLSELVPNPGPGNPANGWSGGGGRFGGAGASDHYEVVADTGDGASSFVPDLDLDVDEFAIPLLLLAFIAALLFASFSIVYSAPSLFAELLLDSALSATLYSRLAKMESGYWLQTAIRRTWATFLVTAIVLAIAGWGMNHYAPDAKSLGEVIELWRV
jgi:hypothetical protein